MHACKRFLCSASSFFTLSILFFSIISLPLIFQLTSCLCFSPTCVITCLSCMTPTSYCLPSFPSSSPLHQFVLSPSISLPTLSSEFSLFSTSNWFSLGFFYVPNLFYWSMHWAPFLIKVVVHIIQVIFSMHLKSCAYCSCYFYFCMSKMSLYAQHQSECCTLYCCIHCKCSCCVTEQAHLISSYLKYQSLVSPTCLQLWQLHESWQCSDCRERTLDLGRLTCTPCTHSVLSNIEKRPHTSQTSIL